MARNTSNHNPVKIIVDDAKLLRLVAPADFFFW